MKGAIRRLRNLRIATVFHIHVAKLRCVKMTMRIYRAKKGVYGGEITYQLRIQRYIELGVIRKLSKFRV